MKTSFPRPSLHFPNYIRVIAGKIQLTSVLLKTIWCFQRIIHKIFVTWFLLQKTSITGTWKNTDLSYSSDHWVHDYLAYNLSDVENRALFIVLSYACNLLNLIIEIIQYCFSFFCDITPLSRQYNRQASLSFENWNFCDEINMTKEDNDVKNVASNRKILIQISD